LAVIAAMQIAGRDAIIQPDAILPFTSNFTIDELSNHVKKFARDRVILGIEDCRTPHQRFAAALLNKVIKGQDADGRKYISDALNLIVSSDSFPILGIRNLLHELFFAGNDRWAHFIHSDSLKILTNRCWKAKTQDERNVAAITIAELNRFHSTSLKDAIEGNEILLAKWVVSSEHPSGYGLGRLLNTLGQELPEIGRLVLDNVDPVMFADKINQATPDNAYTVSELTGRAASIGHKDWNAKVSENIKVDACVKIGADWPQEHGLHSISEFCAGLLWYNEDLPIQMAQALIPQAQAEFAQNPFDARSQLGSILWRVLYLDNALGVYPKPNALQLKIGRGYFAKIDAKAVSLHFAALSLRQMQNAWMFMDVLRKCSKTKFNEIIGNLDWKALSKLYENEWADPSHEAEILPAVLSATDTSRELVVDFFSDNQAKLGNFPPRWAVIAPDVAIEHIDQGKAIRLGRYSHVDWTFGPYVILLVAEKRPELLLRTLEQCRSTLVKSFSQSNASWFREANNFLEVLSDVAPDFLASVVAQVDTNTAKSGWIDSLRKGGKTRNAVAILIEVGLSLKGDISGLSKELRIQFPRSSIPHYSHQSTR